MSKFFYKDKPIIGLDISSTGVKLMSIDPKKWLVNGYGSLDLDPQKIRESLDNNDITYVAENLKSLLADKIIGSVSFTDIKSSMKSCVIGYKIDEKYRRMGYGRRMLTMALKIMVTEYGMHRIEAYILPGNDASVNLARTMGFISEGSAYAYAKINKEWRDHLRFTYIS